MCIRFDKIVGFIEVYSGIRCLVSLEYNEIYDKIKCLIIEQKDITDNIDWNFAKIRIDSHKSLPIEKILIFYNAIILIKSIVNELKINYYTIFSENGLFKDKSNTEYFKWVFVHYKCYILRELTFLKELMLIKQVRGNS